MGIIWRAKDSRDVDTDEAGRVIRLRGHRVPGEALLHDDMFPAVVLVQDDPTRRPLLIPRDR